MKLLPIAGAVFLVACSNTTTVKKPQAPLEMTVSTSAFVDACIKSSPSFSIPNETLQAYGLGKPKSLGAYGKIATRNDKSLNVQIKANQGCIVTTRSKNDSQLTTRFTQSVAKALNLRTPVKVPFQAIANGQRYLFNHDRKGGEAFVMSKVK